MLTIHLQIAGALCLLLVAIYPVYPRRFGWRKELQAVSLLVRQMFWVHTGFILMLLTLQGVLLIAFPGALLESSVAATSLLVGIACFWVFRLIAQLAIYDRRLWVGNRLHTWAHVAFTALFTYVSAVSMWALGVQVI